LFIQVWFDTLESSYQNFISFAVKEKVYVFWGHLKYDPHIIIVQPSLRLFLFFFFLIFNFNSYVTNFNSSFAFFILKTKNKKQTWILIGYIEAYCKVLHGRSDNVSWWTSGSWYVMLTRQCNNNAKIDAVDDDVGQYRKRICGMLLCTLQLLVGWMRECVYGPTVDGVDGKKIIKKKKKTPSTPAEYELWRDTCWPQEGQTRSFMGFDSCTIPIQ
jgi:hypothetical protein